MKYIRNFTTLNDKIFIKNIDLPICIKCIHFIKFKNNNDYEDYPIKNIHLSKCSKFGVKNLLSGEIEYETAIRVRYDKSMCSETAIHFSENK